MLLSTALLGAALQAWAQEPAATTPPAPPAVERKSRLQGKVYLGRNRDVTGAAVRVRREGDPTRVWLTSTDEKGVFRVEGLGDGSYDVRVERDGLEPMEKSEIGVRFPFRAVVELAMKPQTDAARAATSDPTETAPASVPVRLEGVVRDVALDAVAEARVRVVDATGRSDPRVATTGSDGVFGFDDLAPGDWSIQVRGVGRLPIRLRLGLRSDTTLDAILVRQPATYVPSPFELMPPEEPVVPEAFRPPPAPTPAPQPDVRTAK